LDHSGSPEANLVILEKREEKEKEKMALEISGTDQAKLEKLYAEIDEIDMELANNNGSDKDYQSFFDIKQSTFFEQGFI